ncbi:hypothetical protein SEVIR_1G095850v4 [Setaria viridis]
MLHSDDSAVTHTHTHTHTQHTHESDLAVAITGAADHQLLPIPKWPLPSIMQDALMVTMACNGMDHCSAIAIGAMDLQCLGLGGSYIDGAEPALTQRGLLQKPFCNGGGESRPRRRWSPSPHLLAAQASAFPHLHPHTGRYVNNRPEFSISGLAGVAVGAVGGRCADDQPEVGG